MGNHVFPGRIVTIAVVEVPMMVMVQSVVVNVWKLEQNVVSILIAASVATHHTGMLAQDQRNVVISNASKMALRAFLGSRATIVAMVPTMLMVVNVEEPAYRREPSATITVHAINVANLHTNTTRKLDRTSASITITTLLGCHHRTDGKSCKRY
jgi:hypothetical protein